MKRKGDIEIGKRAAELVRAHGSVAKEMRRVGLDKKLPWQWDQGLTPDGRSLQALAFCGYDIYYILTGRKR